MKKRILTSILAGAIIGGAGIAAHAQVQFTNILWQDDFESYDSLADVHGVYEARVGQNMHFTSSGGVGSSKGLIQEPGAGSALLLRFPLRLDQPSYKGTDAAPLAVFFDMKLSDDDTNARHFMQFYSYPSGDYLSDPLAEILAIGVEAGNTLDQTRLHGRLYAKGGWRDLEAPRSLAIDNWVNLGMVVKSETVEFYVDHVLDTVVDYGGETPIFNYVLIGAGQPTTNTGWFDNLQVGITTPGVIPEPSTYAAIFGGIALAGALFARRRRK